MPLTNAEKQAALRARRTRAGLVLFQAWVTPEQAARLKAVISNPTMPPPDPVGLDPMSLPVVKPSRRRRKPDPVAENNRNLILQHKEAIMARLRAGEKPTQIAQWLQTQGFVGTGATFNGFWREV